MDNIILNVHSTLLKAKFINKKSGLVSLGLEDCLLSKKTFTIISESYYFVFRIKISINFSVFFKVDLTEIFLKVKRGGIYGSILKSKNLEQILETTKKEEIIKLKDKNLLEFNPKIDLVLIFKTYYII